MALNDLTGTTWKLLNTLYTYPVAGRTAATFTIAYTTSAPLTSTYGDEIDSFESVTIGYLSGNEVNGVMAFPVQTGSGICFLAQGHDTKTLPDAWVTYFTGTFTITGGVDATNANLIAWLQANAEQVIPDVAIKYNGEVISTLDYGQSVTLEAEGKYMADDVTVETNAVKQGSAGTPVATKGAVSNHAVSVTPSVTNTTGYITGGTLSGTPATVQASELVSGTKQISISASGTITEDVTNYASAEISVPKAVTHAGISRDSVIDHSVTLRPSIHVDTPGFIVSNPFFGQPETVTAGQLTSGTLSITENGTGIDVTNYSMVDVAVSGGGGGDIAQFSVAASYPMFYVDSNGNYIEYQPDPMVSTYYASSLRGSLVCILETTRPAAYPFAQSGLTLQKSVSVGGRNATYSKVHIYTVGT